MTFKTTLTEDQSTRAIELMRRHSSIVRKERDKIIIRYDDGWDDARVASLVGGSVYQVQHLRHREVGQAHTKTPTQAKPVAEAAPVTAPTPASLWKQQAAPVTPKTVAPATITSESIAVLAGAITLHAKSIDNLSDRLLLIMDEVVRKFGPKNNAPFDVPKDDTGNPGLPF